MKPRADVHPHEDQRVAAAGIPLAGGRVSEPISRMFVGWPGRTGRVAARAARASGVSGAAALRVLSS